MLHGREKRVYVPSAYNLRRKRACQQPQHVHHWRIYQAGSSPNTSYLGPKCLETQQKSWDTLIWGRPFGPRSQVSSDTSDLPETLTLNAAIIYRTVCTSFIASVYNNGFRLESKSTTSSAIA